MEQIRNNQIGNNSKNNIMNKRIYLSSPTMHGDEEKFVKEAFDTNWIAPLGPNVNEFEKELASYVGIKEGAALSSGTSAIHLALVILGVKEGDMVFCSDLTFAATVNPVMYMGAKPVFIDSENETWNMSPIALKKAFEQFGRPKAVIVANLYGTPAKLTEIKAICDEYETPLIEDAAESLGALHSGKMTGTFGDIGIFSFNGNKIITTSGGGMLVSDNIEYVKKARFLSTQARENERFYEHKEVGYNYRMSNVVAGIGRGQLLHLNEHILKKEEIYNKYASGFKDIDAIEMNKVLSGDKSNYWLSCITLNEECKLRPIDIILALEKENIESRHIWKPMHMQPVFEGYDFIGENFVCKCVSNADMNIKDSSDISVSKDIFLRGLCLPSDVKNTDENMEKIIWIIRKLF